MAPDTRISGTVIIEDTPIGKFPEGMKVKSLRLKNTQLVTLAHITVANECKLEGTGVVEIGPGVHVGGNFSAADTALRRIDASFQCAGSVDITKCPIAALEFAGCGGSLKAKDSGLTTIRPGFTTGGSKKKGPEGRTEADMHLTGTKITELPPGTKILDAETKSGGDLFLPVTCAKINNDFQGRSIWLFDTSPITHMPVGPLVHNVCFAKQSDPDGDFEIVPVTTDKAHFKKEREKDKSIIMPGMEFRPILVASGFLKEEEPVAVTKKKKK
jgi:hypothetical protein